MTRKMMIPTSRFGGMTANERRLGRFLRDGTGHPDPAPVVSEVPSDDDAFSAAFATHAADEPTPPSAPATPEAAPAAAADPGAGGGTGGDVPGSDPAPAAEPAAGGDAGAVPVAEPAAAPPSAAPSAEPAAKPADPAPNADDVLNRLAGLINQTPPAPAPAAAPPAEVPPVYSEAEQAQLAEYEKNWPDVAAAETLRRKGEYQDLLAYTFQQVHAYYAPLVEQVRMMGNTLHLGEVKALVPDYTESLETEVASWVDTQPSYLQKGMKQVMQSGTSEEIKDLIGRYREATGAAPAASAPAPSPAPAAPAAPKAPAKTELSSAAKQAADLLAPVSGERSQIPQSQEDPGDYDSAFAKYAATM